MGKNGKPHQTGWMKEEVLKNRQGAVFKLTKLIFQQLSVFQG